MGVNKITLLEYGVGFALRAALMQSGLQQSIQNRVELSTPLNAFSRLQEGIYLFRIGVDPYSGDLFHETPITLVLFHSVIQYLGSWIQLLFIGIDLLTAYLLLKTAATYVHTIKAHEKSIRNDQVVKTSNINLTDIDVAGTPILVAYAYLFNPFIVLNCVALTTTTISNFLHAILLYGLIHNKKPLCVIALALSTLQTLYPVLLLVPVCLHFYNSQPTKATLASLVLSFAAVLAALLNISYTISGSWLFIDSIYSFIVNVDDLTPNIGLFWYFFTEMFEHFRALFIAALQINATVLYLVPLSLHLKKEPVFLSVILMCLTATFKSYPSLGDVGFYLALLPMWRHLFLFMQQLFVVACMLVITSVLGPTVWHLWIYSGSANANFFFGVTLAFATAQIFLITDLLFAHKKREFALKFGWPEDTTMEYVGGAMAGVSACVFTNPLDVVKTRLQLQGELRARGQHVVHYRNTLHAFYVIARTDGFLALQKGLVPALWFQVFLNGIRLGTFGRMEELGLTRKADGSVSVFKTVVVSAAGGCLGCFVGSPLYLVKTHLQSKAAAGIAVGHQHSHKAGTVSALVEIYGEQGLRGLWRGSSSALPRIAVGSATQLSMFSLTKQFIHRHKIVDEEKPLLSTFVASMLSGVVVALFMTPFDVVQTRLYNQGVDAEGRGLLYSSIPDCFQKMWRTEGLLGFFKGLGPCYLRIGPHTVLTLVFFDIFNSLRSR